MLRRTFVVVLVGLGGLGIAACGPARKELPAQTPVSISREAPPPHARWKEVDQLIEDQKLEEASRIAEERLAEAKAAKDAEEWTRALVRLTQLRMGLHGDETAVRFLREQPWPDSPIHRVVLNLYYATTLRNYAAQYGWELRQRERIDTQGEVDLKRWSFDQVSEAMYAALAEAWAQREALQDVPVTRFAEYLESGTYPEDVRGTMRDALSYLLANALADSSAWTPAQSSGAYRVDLGALLGAGDARLGDASVHPLLRMAAVLDDLEQWHARSKRRQAELEARLERVRLLAMHRSAEEDQAVLRGDLEKRVPEFRDVPWFAAGKAMIALLWQNAGNLVKAHAEAREGQQAYPESIGGKACQATVAAIEAPDYQLQAMASDGLNRRSIQVQHRNLEALWLRAYAIDVEARLEKTPHEVFPDDRELRKIIAQTPVKAWKVALPPTPDFQQHVTYDTPPFEKHGTYVIVASAREDFGTERNRIVATFMHVGALVLSVTSEPDGTGLSVRVVRGEGGEAVAGATVEVREQDWQSRTVRTSRYQTDARGYVGVQRLGGRDGEQKAYYVTASFGDERVFHMRSVSLLHFDPLQSIQSTLVYTDRSVYRPQQKVQWKVVAYGGDPRSQRYRTRPGSAINVFLLDPNGEVVDSRRSTTNAFGSIAGEFVIPTGRPLGGWTVRAGTGTQEIRVEEYKRPTFEVAFPEDQAELRLNAPAKMKGEARYYFGLPVTQGKVQWTVRRVPRFPWWGWGRPPQLPAEVIATGETPLRDDGTFELAFTPQADARVSLPEQVSYAFEVNAAVTDEGGETRSATRTTVLGFSAVQAQVTASAGFFEPGRAPTFQILRSDLDGKPRGGQGRYRVVKLAAPTTPVLPSEVPPPEPPFAEPGRGPKPLTPGDKLSPRWGSGLEYGWQAELRRWADADQVTDGTVAHDESGGARVEVRALAAGAYRLHYETRDEGGNAFKTQEEFVVAGAPVMVPLFAAVEQGTVKPGGRARLWITSGFSGQQVMVEIRRQGRTERRLLTAGTDLAVIEVPVGESDRGGVSIVASLIHDYQAISIRTGVTVPFDHKELQISFETFRDRLRPGAKDTFRVRVAGPNGARVDAATAELLAYMYDKSLDYFAPHSPPSITTLYQQRLPYAWTVDSLGQAQLRWLSQLDFPQHVEFPQLEPTTLRLIDDHGIGGMGVRRGTMMQKTMPMAAAESRAAGAPPPPPSPAGRGSMAENLVVSDAAAEPPGSQPAPGALRTEFSETAFFAPQLRLAADGTATIEFTVPDSVTSWNVWVHALTKDLAGASTTKETRSIKELMVRPYLPRFLREGDEATLEVVLNSAAAQALSGKVTIEVFDAATNAPVDDAFALKTREAPFRVEPGKSAKVAFALKAPRQVGSYGFRVRAAAGEFADGEQRAIPVLPSRMRLAQSRFVPLREGQTKTMTFAELAAGDDPSLVTEQLVVTVDAQLFYTALQAVPYLVDYPYECTEQTLNRFVSSGILTSLYDRYPAVATMAKQLSARTTQLEAFDAPDPNRRMLLEESPWLQESRGGIGEAEKLLNVLNPVISRTQRESSLGDLRKMQQPDGAFPWFPGGPPSPYMTLYVMAGLARAAEYKVPVPKEVTVNGWGYLARYFHSEQAPLLKNDKQPCCLEFLTFLNFVASSYPDDSYMGEALTSEERRQIAEYTFKHWRQLSPYLKGMLSLTLHRMNRSEDARTVFASVLDSAKTTEELGTYWAPEDRAWLWYNDTTESHAFALRVLMELSPKDARRHGLVQWLLLDKKLSHWKSTRATAEAIYALVKYLEAEGALGVAEQVRVQVAGRTVDLAFSPSAYTGKKNQIVISGGEVKPKEHADVRVEKKGKGLAFASATWHFSTEKLPAAEQGDFFQVSRRYFIRAAKGNEVTLRPLGEGEALKPGDEVEVQLSIRAKHAAEYVHLQDPRAAGLEPDRATSGYKWDLGLAYYEETRDSATNFFFDWLPAGEYTLRYRVRASMAGSFRIGPATLQSLYAPEFNAYSAGQQLQIAGAPMK